MHADPARASTAASRRAARLGSSLVAVYARWILPSRVEGDAVVRPRQVLGRQPEVHGVAAISLERPLRCEPRLARLLATEHRRLRLADHLDVAQGEVGVVGAEVEVVHAERLLEDRRVLLARQREHGLAVVEHVVAADLIRAVRQAVRMPVVRRPQEQLRRVRRTARDHHDVTAVASPSPPSRLTTTSVTAARPGRSRAHSTRALTSRVTFGCSSAGRTPSTSASDLPCTAHGKPSQFTHRTQAL